jgi:hypothetical protein
MINRANWSISSEKSKKDHHRILDNGVVWIAVVIGLSAAFTGV